MNNKTEPFLNISIRDRSQVVFKGMASSLTSYNEIGEFDVLPQHANFITLIKDSIILNKEKENKKEIKIKSGIMNVAQDKVDVYLGF